VVPLGERASRVIAMRDLFYLFVAVDLVARVLAGFMKPVSSTGC
jgi:hypothetical protein